MVSLHHYSNVCFLVIPLLLSINCMINMVPDTTNGIVWMYFLILKICYLGGNRYQCNIYMYIYSLICCHIDLCAYYILSDYMLVQMRTIVYHHMCSKFILVLAVNCSMYNMEH